MLADGSLFAAWRVGRDICQLLCVFHTDFVDGDCEIRAVRPREEE